MPIYVDPAEIEYAAKLWKRYCLEAQAERDQLAIKLRHTEARLAELQRHHAAHHSSNTGEWLKHALLEGPEENTNG